MKAKVVIALLCVWAVLATITAVDNENRRSRLYDECVELQDECERQEREYEQSYEKLKKEYDKLEEDCEEYKDMYYSEQSTRVDYEWLLDVCANQGNESYDADASLERILRREYSWLNMEIVDEQTFAAVMRVHKQKAKLILLDYDIGIKIK